MKKTGIAMNSSVRAVVVMVLVCVGVAAQAGDYYVTTNGTGKGTSWNDPTNNLQGAVTACPAGYKVLVSNGVYTSASVNSSVVTINKSMELRGVSGNPADVTLDGSGTNRGVYVSLTSTGYVLIAGFTITNCSASDMMGGGIRIYHGTITAGTAEVQNCVIAGNTTRAAVVYGGGGGIHSIAAAASSVFLTSVSNCTIAGNTAFREGGGGAFFYWGRVIMQDCRILGNTANDGTRGMGGGICAYYNTTEPFAKLLNWPELRGVRG